MENGQGKGTVRGFGLGQINKQKQKNYIKYYNSKKEMFTLYQRYGTYNTHTYI